MKYITILHVMSLCEHKRKYAEYAYFIYTTLALLITWMYKLFI